MLNQRQKKILELIESRPIGDQSSLLSALGENGILATQATVSRDIRKLQLKKSKKKNSDGTVTVRYVSVPQVSKEEKDNKFTQIFLHSVTSIDMAQNLVVVKTHTGMAQAFCAVLDSVNFTQVIATLAGDDTIIAVCRTTDDAQVFMDTLKTIYESTK